MSQSDSVPVSVRRDSPRRHGGYGDFMAFSRVFHSRPSFGLEWGFSFVQPDCRCHSENPRSSLRLRSGL